MLLLFLLETAWAISKGEKVTKSINYILLMQLLEELLDFQLPNMTHVKRSLLMFSIPIVLVITCVTC